MTRGYVTDRAKASGFSVRWVAAAAVLACGLVLGSCGPDESKPTRSSSSASSAVPSVTTPPEPVKSPEPVVPDAMTDPGEDGAIAAAKYFLELYAYAFNTWDLSAWNAVSEPECAFCQSVADGIAQHQAAGERVETSQTVIHDIAVEAPNALHAHYLVTIKATQGSSRTYGRNYELVREVAAKTQVIRLAVLRVDEAWILHEGGASAVD